MVNNNPKIQNLTRQKSTWKHLPTKAIRLPQRFEPQILEFVQSLDSGKTYVVSDVSDISDLETTLPSLQTWKLEHLLKLQSELGNIIHEKKEAQCDRRLENAILYLAGRCDGAASWDGQGFNKIDTGFGHSLADRIEAGDPLLVSQAEPALKMITKYKKQLAAGELSLPTWEEIAHQYPSRCRRTPNQQTDIFELPPRRMEIIGNTIAVYAPYDPTNKFQKAAKSIDGWEFNGNDKSWRFPLRKIEEVLETFGDGYQLDPNIEGALALLHQQRDEEQAAKEAQALEVSSEVVKLVCAANLDSPLANGWYLREYQKRGVEWLLAHRTGGIYRGGILADQMGLGKSLTSLVAARAMQSEYNCPIFIIAPVSLLENWKREAERAEVRVECYSWAKLPMPLENQPYVLIADESHNMQDLESQRTKKTLKLAQHNNCLAVWLLTGTPIKNGRPINLFPLLLAANHPLGNNIGEYEKYYCNAGYVSIGRGGKQIWDTTGASHLDELAKKTDDVILRRMKEDCLKELPAKTRIFKKAELEKKLEIEYLEKVRLLIDDYRQRSQSSQFIKNLMLLFKTPSINSWYAWVLAYNPVDKSAEALVTINILRKIGSEAKVPFAVALAQEILNQQQSVVLFTDFVESAKAIHEQLGGELLTGESKPKERQAMVDRFQSRESKVFVGTVKAGGVGLTLTASSDIILVDRPWTSAETEQAEDRVHRIGQKDAVFASWLQLGQIDESIDSLIAQKHERTEIILKGKAKTLGNITSAKELAEQLLEIL